MISIIFILGFSIKIIEWKKVSCKDIDKGLKNRKDTNKYCKIKDPNFCINYVIDDIFDYNKIFNFNCSKF